MAPLGISRVTDITRMDRLGLPVFASIRPRGRSLRVHAGKGLDAQAARVGALMEAVEFAVAEPLRTRWAAETMTLASAFEQFGGELEPIDFAPLLDHEATPDQMVTTVACESLGQGRIVRLPAELVFMPFEEKDTPAVFGWTSTGLASGNSVEEATLHGLLEVLERDALSMDRAQARSRWLTQLPAPFSELVAAWESLGIRTAVRWLPNPFGVTCVHACLHEPGSDGMHLAAGAGAHLDPRHALARALCEAAQSRLSHIHGGRDDIVRFYGRYNGLGLARREELDRPFLTRMFDASRPLDFATLAGAAWMTRESSLGQLLSGLLDSMASAGFDTVLRHRFEIELGGMSVVKVVVPRCEDVENSAVRMGRRLFSAVTGEVH